MTPQGCINKADAGPVLLYLTQVDIQQSLLGPNTRLSVTFLQPTPTDPDGEPTGQIDYYPVSERMSTNSASGNFRPCFVPAAPRASLDRFLERVKGNTGMEAPGDEETLNPPAPAVPLPKDTKLSSEIMVAVYKDASDEPIGIATFNLWELLYNPDRSLTLSLTNTSGAKHLQLERSNSGTFRPMEDTEALMTRNVGGRGMGDRLGQHHSRCRRHSWSIGGRVLSVGATQKLLKPTQAGIRVRQKFGRGRAASWTGLHVARSFLQARRKSSNASDIARMLPPGLIQVSLAPRSISRRDGGVVGIPQLSENKLNTSIRRAFDVPYNSNWIIGKAPDPVIQAAYEFWSKSHAMIPESVCAKGVLLFEELFKQDADFNIPNMSSRSLWKLEAMSTDSSAPDSAGKISIERKAIFADRERRRSQAESMEDGRLRARRDSQATVSDSRFRKDSFTGGSPPYLGADLGGHAQLAAAAAAQYRRRSEPPVPSPAALQIPYDKDLLMYKIAMWDESQVEIQGVENTWSSLPDEQVLGLKAAKFNISNAPERTLGGSPAPAAGSPTTSGPSAMVL